MDYVSYACLSLIWYLGAFEQWTVKKSPLTIAVWLTYL